MENDDRSSDAEDAGMKTLAVNAGAWKLLSSPNELLLALRERGDGPLTDLSELQPRRAVLAGDLSEMQPSDLLNFLHQGRRTGVLLTRSDGTERGIVLIDGNLAWACSTSSGERLGELLVRMGLVSKARVEEVLRDQSSGEKKRIGQALVDLGVLSEESLRKGVQHQVVEIFLGLLVARSGSFVFLRGLDGDKLPTQLALDTQGMLLDGLRRLDEMELYRSRVPGPEVKPRGTGKTPSAALEDDEQQVLALADGSRSVADLATAATLGLFDATRAVYKLVLAGYLAV